MNSQSGVRRVIIVVLDGLRPDAIDAFGLTTTDRVMRSGASSWSARTIDPPLTTAAMTSLMTGVNPGQHGITGDRVFIPRSTRWLTPMPQALADSGFPSAAFLAELPTLMKGIGARVGRRLGFGTTQFVGKRAAEILVAARTTLRVQRRGLIVLHWPDADRAGHQHGWMSAAYGAACRDLDVALGHLCSAIDLESDSSTMLVALADHGGGGAEAKNHESRHALDMTIPLAFAGPGIIPASLADASLLDVSATTLYALGVPVPTTYEGHPHADIFAAALRTAVA